MNQEKDILKRTSQVLRDKFITIEVDIIKPSFLDKLFKKPTVRVFKVRRATLATLYFFSETVLDLTKSKPNGIAGIIALLSKDITTMVRAIAILLTSSDEEPREELTRFLQKNLDTTDYKAILVYLLEHSKIEDFTSSIILIKEMSLLKTEEMIASEKIASGQQLAER